jgi:hypothetical protein
VDINDTYSYYLKYKDRKDELDKELEVAQKAMMGSIDALDKNQDYYYKLKAVQGWIAGSFTYGGEWYSYYQNKLFKIGGSMVLCSDFVVQNGYRTTVVGKNNTVYSFYYKIDIIADKDLFEDAIDFNTGHRSIEYISSKYPGSTIDSVW